MYFRQLRHMYYVSLSNVASTQRLLEKNRYFAEFEESQSVHDLVVYLFPNEHKESDIRTTVQGIAGQTQDAQRKAAVCHKPKRRISEETKDARYITEETKDARYISEETKDAHYISDESKDTLEHVEPVDDSSLEDYTQSCMVPVLSFKKSTKDKECMCGIPTDSSPAPLTMEKVVMENTIMEAKVASSNWTNYATEETDTCFVPGQSVEKKDASN